MIIYILRKVFTFLLILLCLSQISFSIVYYMPDTPFYSLSFTEAYFSFFEKLVSGNLYLSLHNDMSLIATLKQILPNTMEFCLLAILVSLIIGIPLGILAGLNTDKWQNKVLQTLCLIIGSSPLVWLAVLIMFIFASNLNILPTEGALIKSEDSITGFSMIDIFLTPNIDHTTELLKEIQYFALPVIILSIQPCIITIQLISQSIQHISQQNYIKTAIIREQSQLKVLFRHLLPNALPPIIPQLTHSFTLLLSAAMVVEIIFERPGLGKWVIEASYQQNGVAIAIAILVCGVLISSLNLFSELVSVILHPLRHKELYDQ